MNNNPFEKKNIEVDKPEILLSKTQNLDSYLYSHYNIDKASEKAQEYGFIIVLKGANTLIATPDGKLYFNSTGNPGMASGGMGDVLTGIIVGLLAQGYSSTDSAVLGVYLHGLSADLALQTQSEESLLASDVAGNLGNTFKHLR